LGIDCRILTDGRDFSYLALRPEGVAIIRGAVDRGITFFDTAEAYGTHTLRDATKKSRPTRRYRPTWAFDRHRRQGRSVSVQGLFREITDRQDSFEHDVLYGALGSDIVHPGPFSLLSLQRQISRRDTFVLRPTPNSGLCTIALASSNMAMFLVLDSLTEYLGLDPSAELDELKATAQTSPYSGSEGDSSNG
jgi:hypothetical protein